VLPSWAAKKRVLGQRKKSGLRPKEKDVGHGNRQSKREKVQMTVYIDLLVFGKQRNQTMTRVRQLSSWVKKGVGEQSLSNHNN